MISLLFVWILWHMLLFAIDVTIRLNLYSLCMTRNPKFKIECSIDIRRLTQYKSGMLCKMRQDLSRPFAIAANASHCSCNKLSHYLLGCCLLPFQTELLVLQQINLERHQDLDRSIFLVFEWNFKFICIICIFFFLLHVIVA